VGDEEKSLHAIGEGYARKPVVWSGRDSWDVHRAVVRNTRCAAPGGRNLSDTRFSR